VTAKVRLVEYTREELAQLSPESVLVVPTGATEQHGPHLPVGTDGLIVEHVALDAARIAGERGARCLVAPLLSYGSSHHHLPFPGTLSLTGSSFLQAIRDLGESATQWGVTKLFFLNGHGGNESLVHQAVRDLVLRADLVAGAASYWSLAKDKLLADSTLRDVVGTLPGHAGGFETSIILALRPDLVDQDDYPSEARSGASWSARWESAAPLVERTGWFSAIDGYTDLPTHANSEVGSRLLDHIVDCVSEFLVDFAYEH